MVLKPDSPRGVKLNIPAQPSFLPVATAFVEKSAQALGLEESEALLLTLATEELFLYLCQTASDREVEIQCSGGGYYVRAEFIVLIENLSLKAFNLTTKIQPDEEASLEDLGLVLASRSVDRFQIWEEKGRGMHLSLVKEKSYPEAGKEAPLSANPLSRYDLRTPDQEELKTFTRMALHYYPPQVLPVFFPFPGKVADMAAAGEFKVVVAFDPHGAHGRGDFMVLEGAKDRRVFRPLPFQSAPGFPHG